MTTQNTSSTPRCTTCPASRQLTTIIQHYAVIRQSLRLFLFSEVPVKNRSLLQTQMRMVDSFINRLRHLEQILEEQTNPPESEETP